ncbi:uncharacterized protein LOC126824037 isoform X2 [Patella vulgata]|uniref:uncharacterized protein LOC126824037 isoform X2 n=4 Tax=Patella vulgata TaxID=6465 RepID=UPI00218065E1|nr:uncharacterized protein LOC126824037 isoform X2 [Patella vulgata]
MEIQGEREVKNMFRRRVLVYICVIFLTFETFLLVEQQKNITRDVKLTGMKYSDTGRFTGDEYKQYNGGLELMLNKLERSPSRDGSRRYNTTTGSPESQNNEFILKTTDDSSEINGQNNFNRVKPPDFISKAVPSNNIEQYAIKTSYLNISINGLNVTDPEVNHRLVDRIIPEVFNDLNVKKENIIKQDKSPFLNDERTKQRISRLEKVCKAKPVGGRVVRVLVDPTNTMSYCVIHKIASTHWLRVYRYLWNATKKGHVSSPYKITKMEAHLSPKFKMADHNFRYPLDQRLIMSTRRFMFVREPFTRLWSVYIDKFILADNYFWSFYGPKVARINNMVILPALKPCYHFTFRHFINFVVATGVNPDDMNDHIRPIHRLCNPCDFKPHFVGKLETMTSDSDIVLNSMNVTWGEPTSGKDHRTYQEMKTIIEFNFHIVKDLRLLSRCLNPVSLGKRLLRAFVLNGYIPLSEESVLIEKLPLMKERLLDLVWGVYRSTNRTQAMVKAQRQELKIKAFQTIPLQLMHKLQQIYLMDFELFDYRLDPPEFFYNKKTV